MSRPGRGFRPLGPPARMRSALFGLLASFVALPRLAMAQNDWQFPDPRFGILQSGRFPTPADEQRYRAEISGGTRPARPPEQIRTRGRPRIRAGGPMGRSR
jgi:hypothetical protein